METGDRLGPYRLINRIGQGGMGVVHLAVDPADRAVAVKVLQPSVAADPHARERLAREVDSLRRVHHPRVAEVLDADTDADRPYVVTQYVPAPPLDDFVQLKGPLNGADLARLGDGLGEALAAIHEAGVVHRDLKPANVLMLDGEPVVIDFGIAHVADDVRLTMTGLVMGTPGYLSPEVLDGLPVSHATDWWGWAATMAFAATGRPPFGRGALDAVLDRVRRGAADLDGAPAVFVDVLTRGLAPDPRDRPVPAELRLAVRELWQEQDVTVDERWGEDWGRATHEDVTQVVPRPEPVTQVVPRPEPVTQVVPVARSVPPTRPMPQRAPYQPEPYQPEPNPPEPYDPQPYQPESYDPQPYEPAYEPPYQPAAYDPAYEPPPPQRPRRAGVLLCGLVALSAVAGYLPVVVLIAALVWSVLARTVNAAHGGVLRRRYEYGPRRGDVWLAALASPWHLVVSAAVTVLASVLPVLVGASVAFIVAFVLEGGGQDYRSAVALAAGAFAAAVVGWWGPGGTSLRWGSRTLARALTPGRGGQVIGGVVLLLVAAGAVLTLVRNGWLPDWSPLSGPPFPGLLPLIG